MDKDLYEIMKDAFVQELETDHTRYTTREVREEFSAKKGVNNVERKMDEDEEISERLHKMIDNHPDESFEEVIVRTQKDLSEDASRMRNPNTH